MKVLHLCLCSFFPDNYSYQENLLPKFHNKMGFETEVIASLQTFDENGHVTYYEKAKKYRNEYDIPVTRLDYKEPAKLFKIFKKYIGFKDALEKAAPDVIFMHGCQFLDIKIVANYMKKHPEVKLFVDNHADFSNSATNFVSKNILHKMIWKRCAQLINPYTQKFYGVLPARVDFLVNVYGLPKEKVELLVMGSDDDKIIEADKPEVKKAIREKYNIADDDFLIMTGGKIDLYKTQTLLLMEAVNKLDNPKVKLIVFGSVVPELKDKINELCSDKVQYIGWVKSEDSYQYFSACDLTVFPGRHSVFWEQVAGQGKPMIVKYWDGTTHVDMKGNVTFLHKDSADEIKEEIEKAIENYADMKKVAEDNAHMFKYSDIAKRSIEA